MDLDFDAHGVDVVESRHVLIAHIHHAGEQALALPGGHASQIDERTVGNEVEEPLDRLRVGADHEHAHALQTGVLEQLRGILDGAHGELDALGAAHLHDLLAHWVVRRRIARDDDRVEIELRLPAECNLTVQKPVVDSDSLNHG